MNKKTSIILLIVALLGASGGAVYMGYRFLTSSDELVGFERWVACEACGEVYQGALENRPGKCAKCGEQALWPAGRCADCGAQFPVNVKKLRQKTPEIRCPKCGSKAVGKIPDSPPA